MNALEKVAHYLAVPQESLEVREWAFVYWVHLRGQRPTLVSKKMVDRYCELELLVCLGDSLIRDTKTSTIYAVRTMGWQSGVDFRIKKITQGTRLTSDFEWALLPGESFDVDRTSKPSNVRELLVRRHLAA